MKFRLNEGLENIYDKAQDLFNKIESWEYGCYDSFGNELADKDIWHSVVQEPLQLEKNKKGMCTDYVEYEKDFFINQGYEDSIHTYDIHYTDKDGDHPAHVFLVFEHNNKYYWFEKAWYSEAGIHEFETLDELFKTVAEKHKNTEGTDLKIVEYDRLITCWNQQALEDIFNELEPVYEE
jgi:hypothetical protein